MKLKTILLVISVLFISACSVTGPKYSVSAYNVQTLEKSLNNSVKVGSFTKNNSPAVKDPWSFRGASSVVSPVGKGYNDFLADALQSELMLAGKFDKSSSITITGNIVSHDVDASGFNTGNSNIEVEFKVSDSAGDSYNETKRVDHSWESAFVGVTAAEKASRAYLVMIEKLLANLFNDPKFAEAINNGR